MHLGSCAAELRAQGAVGVRSGQGFEGNVRFLTIVTCFFAGAICHEDVSEEEMLQISPFEQGRRRILSYLVVLRGSVVNVTLKFWSCVSCGGALLNASG